MRRCFFNFIFIGLFLGSFDYRAFSQSLQTSHSASPTNFVEDIRLSPVDDVGASLQQSPGLFNRSMGGQGTYSNTSIRGTTSSDVAITLEGIRLNSSALPSFDFGNLSPFGFDSARITRGGYSSYSTNPSGEIALRLPAHLDYRSRFGLGSFQSLMLAEETPYGILSIEQAQNDFRYEDQGVVKTMNHNADQRVNLRAWYRKPSYQIWTQVLYSDLELPGDISSPSPLASSQTFFPTLAFQTSFSHYELSLWGSFEQLRYSDSAPATLSKTTSRAFNLGQRLDRHWVFSDELAFETMVESNQDKLFTENEITANLGLRSPLRETLSGYVGAFWTPSSKWLIHPQLRGEYVSDLQGELFSAHPGLGVRYAASDSFDLLTNFAWISIAPNFIDMYFAFPPEGLANPNLKRSRSLQGDFGYEWHTRFLGDHWSLRASQAFFMNRTDRLIENIQLANRTFQNQNVGTGVVFGLENEIAASSKHFEIRTSYTVQRASLHDVQRYYQPTHLLTAEPTITESFVRLSVPLYARSSVRAPGFPTSVHLADQFDFGIKVETESEPVALIFQAKNLLGWNRIEVVEHPMSMDPSFQISASYKF